VGRQRQMEMSGFSTTHIKWKCLSKKKNKKINMVGTRMERFKEERTSVDDERSRRPYTIAYDEIKKTDQRIWGNRRITIGKTHLK
jgi:hypothetical protein